MEQFCAGHPDLLHHAARRGRPRLVRYLLKYHVTRLRLGQLDANDMGIPLFNALSVSHGSPVLDVVRALVEVFPARNGKSSEEIRHEMLEVKRVSLQGQPRLTKLLCCLQLNHHGRIDSRIKCSQTVQVFIDAGADPFTVCGRGRNALRYVLDSKCGDCAKVLLARMGSRAAVTMMRDLVESAGGGGGSRMTWQEAHIDIEKGHHHNGSERYQLSMRDELSRWHV